MRKWSDPLSRSKWSQWTKEVRLTNGNPFSSFSPAVYDTTRFNQYDRHFPFVFFVCLYISIISSLYLYRFMLENRKKTRGKTENKAKIQ